MVAAEKELSPHARLMKLLHDRTGPIPDGGAQGKAAKWLSEHYSFEQCAGEFDRQLREAAGGKRKGPVSLLTVQREIGTQEAVRPKQGPRILRRDDDLTRDEAAELLNLLERAGGYERQRELIKSMYGL